MKNLKNEILEIMKETEKIVSEGRQDELMPKRAKIIKNKDTEDEMVYEGFVRNFRIKDFKAIITLELYRSKGKIDFIIDDKKDEVFLGYKK